MAIVMCHPGFVTTRSSASIPDHAARNQHAFSATRFPQLLAAKILHCLDIAQENRPVVLCIRNLIRPPTARQPHLSFPRFEALREEKAMTPQERELIDDLFDRLAKLETAPRDPEAMSAIMQGLRKAPNAVYALVQTALVQDEALKRANDRIQELEAGRAPEQTQSGGFLDSMRDAIFGQNQPRGSVPNVRAPGMGDRPVWNSGEVMQQTQDGRQPPGQYGGRPMASPLTVSLMVRSRRSAAVAARSSEPRRQRPPAWSVARCCSAASAR